jgi:hypothetical protein
LFLYSVDIVIAPIVPHGPRDFRVELRVQLKAPTLFTAFKNRRSDIAYDLLRTASQTNARTRERAEELTFRQPAGVAPVVGIADRSGGGVF